jgi:hypothetical protein
MNFPDDPDFVNHPPEAREALKRAENALPVAPPPDTDGEIAYANAAAMIALTHSNLAVFDMLVDLRNNLEELPSRLERRLRSS